MGLSPRLDKKSWSTSESRRADAFNKTVIPADVSAQMLVPGPADVCSLLQACSNRWLTINQAKNKMLIRQLRLPGSRIVKEWVCQGMLRVCWVVNDTQGQNVSQPWSKSNTQHPFVVKNTEFLLLFLLGVQGMLRSTDSFMTHWVRSYKMLLTHAGMAILGTSQLKWANDF